MRWEAITATQSNTPFPFRTSLSVAVAVVVARCKPHPQSLLSGHLCTTNDILSSPYSLPSSLILALPHILEPDVGRCACAGFTYLHSVPHGLRRSSPAPTAWLRCYYQTCRQDLSRSHHPEAYDAHRRPCLSHPHPPHHRSSNEPATPATEERSSASATDPDPARTALLPA